MRTEKSRLQRRLTDLPDQMRQMHHFSVREQVLQLDRTLWGHYGCRQRRLFRAGSVTDRGLSSNGTEMYAKGVDRYLPEMRLRRIQE